MVDVMANLTEVLSALSPEIADSLGTLITVLKAIGVFFIIYVVYLIVMAVVNFYRVKRLKVIEKKVDSIERKLNKLIKKKK